MSAATTISNNDTRNDNNQHLDMNNNDKENNNNNTISPNTNTNNTNEILCEGVTNILYSAAQDLDLAVQDLSGSQRGLANQLDILIAGMLKTQCSIKNKTPHNSSNTINLR